jgi:hypothetical protein
VLERQVDHRVRGLRAGAQAVEIVQISSPHLGAEGHDRGGRPVRPGQPDHLVTGGDQLGEHGRADPPGRTRDEHSHDEPP